MFAQQESPISHAPSWRSAQNLLWVHSRRGKSHLIHGGVGTAKAASAWMCATHLQGIRPSRFDCEMGQGMRWAASRSAAWQVQMQNVPVGSLPCSHTKGSPFQPCLFAKYPCKPLQWGRLKTPDLIPDQNLIRWISGKPQSTLRAKNQGWYWAERKWQELLEWKVKLKGQNHPTGLRPRHCVHSTGQLRVKSKALRSVVPTAIWSFQCHIANTGDARPRYVEVSAVHSVVPRRAKCLPQGWFLAEQLLS